MIRLLIVDDHAMFRAGLKQIIADEPDLEVVGEAGDAQNAIELAKNIGSSDIMLLDISMPDKGGLDVLKRVKQMNPQLSVLILSAYPEDQYAVRMLRAGAAGYITKESEPEQLVDAIRRVARGGKYVSSAVSERLVEALDAGHEKPLHMALSDREFQIFHAIATGKSSSEIANELSLSVKTIGTYRMRVLEKMGMSRNAELIHYAVANRLLG